MTDDQAKIEKASELLKRHRVVEITTEIIESRYRFSSIAAVEYDIKNDRREYLEPSATGVSVKFEAHEFLIATTEFSAAAFPMFDDDDQYGECLIYFDSVLVLRLEATMKFKRYGSELKLHDRPISIKSMKAGPWLFELEKCYDFLENKNRERTSSEHRESNKKQAGEIDLEDY